MKKILSKLIVIALFAVSLVLFTYPHISSWWDNMKHVATARAYYYNASLLSPEEVEIHFLRANEHNDFISELNEMNIFRFGETAFIPHDYAEILNVDGVMAAFQYPKLPLIYLFFTVQAQTL